MDAIGIGAIEGWDGDMLAKISIGGLGSNFPPYIRVFSSLIAISFTSGRVAPPIVCKVIEILLLKALK